MVLNFFFGIEFVSDDAEYAVSDLDDEYVSNVCTSDEEKLPPLILLSSPTNTL